MSINLVKIHDKTKGPEAHQVYIFDLVGDEPGNAHRSSVFDFEGEKYRAFSTYAKVAPLIGPDNRRYPVHRVRAVKLADERDWAKNGKHGKIDPKVLEGHIAR